MLNIVRDETQFTGRVWFATLPDKNISGSMGTAIPNVANVDLLVLSNPAPIDITNLIGGSDGQRLEILGDTFSTLKNNSNIVTASGADVLMNVHIYRLTYYNGKWYQ